MRILRSPAIKSPRQIPFTRPKRSYSVRCFKCSGFPHRLPQTTESRLVNEYSWNWNSYTTRSSKENCGCCRIWIYSSRWLTSVGGRTPLATAEHVLLLNKTKNHASNPDTYSDSWCSRKYCKVRRTIMFEKSRIRSIVCVVERNSTSIFVMRTRAGSSFWQLQKWWYQSIITINTSMTCRVGEGWADQ